MKFATKKTNIFLQNDSHFNSAIYIRPYMFLSLLVPPVTYNLKQIYILALILLNLGMACLCKQCRSRSVGFWRSQLIWICTVCQSLCEFISVFKPGIHFTGTQNTCIISWPWPQLSFFAWILVFCLFMRVRLRLYNTVSCGILVYIIWANSKNYPVFIDALLGLGF